MMHEETSKRITGRVPTLVGVSLLIAAAATHAETTSRRVVPAPLAETVESLEQLESLHFVAVSLHQFEREGDRHSGLARFEYWEEGGKYRLRSHADEPLRRAGFLGSSDHSWDGRLALVQTAIVEDEVAVYFRRHDVFFSSVPNPLLLYFDYLLPEHYDLAGRSRIAADLPDRLRSLLAAEESSGLYTSQDHGQLRLYSNDGKTEVTFETVALTADGEGEETRTVPTHLTRIRENPERGTQDRMELEFGDFVRKASLTFPTSISIDVYDMSDTLRMRTRILLETLEVDEPIDPSIFRLPIEDGMRIYDADSERVLDSLDELFVEPSSAEATTP